jgi:tetratricopeptide (TPR) repeat protein
MSLHRGLLIMRAILHRFFCLVVVTYAASQSPAWAVDASSTNASRATPIGDKWAVVIGISEFADTSTPKLKYSAKDAQDFYNFLVDPQRGRFSKDHVKLLVNQDATKINILEALGGEFLPYAAGPDDLVIIYLSTHGSPADSDIRGVNYVVAHDTLIKHLFATGINLQQLLQTIKERVHTKRILLCLDTCYSGAGGAAGGKGLVRTNVDGADVAQGIGSLVIASSQPDQRSWESDDLKNSYFTKYLIQSLSKSNGMVDVYQAFEAMKEQVQSDVLHDKGQLQTPTLSGKFDGPGLIVGVAPRIMRRAPEMQLLRPIQQSSSVVASLTPSVTTPNVSDTPRLDGANVTTPQVLGSTKAAKVKPIVEKADAAYDAGKMTEAVELYSNALEIDPDNADVLAYRGLSKFYLKDYVGAMMDATRAGQIDPKWGFPFYVVGRCLLVQHDYEKAVAEFTTCLKWKEFKNAYLYRGQAHYRLKNYSQALSDLNQVINKDQDNWDAHYWRYFTYTVLKQLDFAHEDAELLVKLQPNWGDSWRCLAYVNEDQGKYPESIAAYKQAATRYKAENEPTYEKQALDAIAHLGKMKSQPAPKTEPAAGSTGSLSSSKSADPRLNELKAKGDAAFDSGDSKKAAELYSQMLEIDPHSSYALGNRGLSKFYLKDYIGAFDDATAALKENPRWGFPYYLRGRCHLVQNDIEKAISAFSNCLQRQDSINSLVYRGQCYYRLKNYNLALADLNQVINRDANSWDGHYWRYWVYSSMKQLDFARVDAEALVKLQPTWGDSYRCLAFVNEDQNRIAEAIDNYKRAADAFRSEKDTDSEQKMLQNIAMLSKKK